MTQDDPFRLMLVIIFFTFVPFAAYHRIGSQTDEKLDRWQEGVWILFGLRLSALPWFLGSAAWMINPSWMAWSSVSIPVWLRWCGIGLIVLWGFLLVWTFRHLGKNLTDTVVTRREHALVTTGPYRYVRHPFYLAFIVAVVGGTLVAANWFVLLSGLVPFSFLIARTRIEEEKLIERFGDEYREYMEKTGRFFPSVKR
jgi:protein-S-isoprenylcysteine O-methyltransferase Ste14